MSVLAKKGEKTGITVPYDQYSSMLKYEILAFFSQVLDEKISLNDYDNAVNMTESVLNTKFELPCSLTGVIVIIAIFLLLIKKQNLKTFLHI